jgi:serine/threonine protein kinase
MKAVERQALDEDAVWTLMYQLFAALAYLHYGISISKEGACRVEHHWDTMLHRDIKPHNSKKTSEMIIRGLFFVF